MDTEEQIIASMQNFESARSNYLFRGSFGKDEIHLRVKKLEGGKAAGKY